jgi:type I restriction enzyme S subunit
MPWSSVEIQEAIRKTKVGRDNQILSSDIQPTGHFPVVDQGQAFVAGYSDEEGRVIRDDLPLVIFGDHTRCLKYVDFPFILGADGTKVLKPKEDLFDPKFFYYALLSFDIPNRGYNRHFTVLKEKTVPCPEKDEQHKIAAVLGVVQRAIDQQERLLALTAELKKTLLHQLFTQGLRDEPQKQTEIGPVPVSWEVVMFEDFALLQRGFDLSKSEFRQGPYPVVGATKTIGFHDKYNVNGPGVTVVRSGSSAGMPQFVPNNFWAHNVVLFVKNFHGHNPKFVYYKIKHLDLTKYREGVAVPTLNRNSFRLIPVAVPLRDEQDEFVHILDAVEAQESIHLRKRAALTDLFRTLLHQLMTAQIRVHDLDLPGLG